MLSTLAKRGPTRPARCSTLPPARADATMPSSGMPMPVMRKPSRAQVHAVPAAMPMNGGKIRLPAPKNIANSATPTTSTSVEVLRIKRQRVHRFSRFAYGAVL